MQDVVYLEGVLGGVISSLVLYLLTCLLQKYLNRRRKSVPIDIAQLAQETAETNVEFEGGSFKVWYRPNRVTTKWVKSMRKAETDRDEDVMMEELTKLVKDWELTSGDEKVPVTAETFSELPLKLMQAIIRAVMQASTGTDADDEGKAA